MTSNPTQGLFPGYKHVDAFGADDEYESDEVEECYVTLDLGSVEQTLVPSSASYRLIGLDTPTPFLQLSGTVMRGQVRTLLGTELIFKDASERVDAARERDNAVQYVARTERRVLFREVELKPKKEAAPPLPAVSSSVPVPGTDAASIPEPAGTVDAALQQSAAAKAVTLDATVGDAASASDQEQAMDVDK